MGNGKKKLSGRRLLFVKALLADPHRVAKTAYVAAGYTAKNDHVAEVAASRLLSSVEVQEAIREHEEKLSKKYEAQGSKAIDRLMRGVQFDIRKLYHLEDDLERGIKAGQLKLPHELDDEAAAMVVGARYNKSGVFLGYQSIDVKGSCELIGRHFKLFTDRVELSAGGGLADALAKARARARGKRPAPESEG